MDELRALGEPSQSGLGALAAALGERDPQPLEVRRLMGGAQAATHAVRFPTAGWVVLKRWPSPDRDAPAKEAARLGVAQTVGVPVPTPLAADPDGSWFGRPALATTFLEGEVVVHPDIGGWVGEMADTLAAIHGADVTGHGPVLDEPHSGLVWRPLPAERFPRTPRVRALLAAVESLQRDTGAVAGPGVLLHHDFRQNNLLWIDGRISAVLDWHHARLGPAVSDLAYLTVDVVRTNGLRAVDAVVRAYQERRGQVDDLARWQALWLCSQLPWMHGWTTIAVPGSTTLTRRLVTRRLHALADTVLKKL